MEELRPLLGVLGLVVVAGAIVVAVARARGRRFRWWDRFMSPERSRRTGGRKNRPPAPSAARRTASAESGESGSRPKGRSGRRSRSRSARGSDRQTALGLEDIPLLDPVEGPRATALDREFDMGDLSELGKGEAQEGADAARARPPPPESAADAAPDEAGEPESDAAPAQPGAEEVPEPEPPSSPRKPPRSRRRASFRAAPQPPAGNAPAEPGRASGNGRAGEEMLVVLTIMTPDERRLAGPRILEAFASFDLETDEDGLFHHFGNRKGSSRQPVFSVASVLEPGVFDLDGMDAFETPGLCLFMRRPGPFLATVAFDLMLDVGSRLARALGAVLCDHQRCRLTVQATQALRERVIHFALRHEREVPIRK